MDYLLGMILGILLCSQWHLLSDKETAVEIVDRPVSDLVKGQRERTIKSRKLIERKKRV